MKRSRVNEEQILAILKEQESGPGTADLCRRHGISSATFCKWKAKFGGLDMSDARRLKALEDEDTRLKKRFWPRPCWTTLSSRRLLQKTVTPFGQLDQNGDGALSAEEISGVQIRYD